MAQASRQGDGLYQRNQWNGMPRTLSVIISDVIQYQVNLSADSSREQQLESNLSKTDSSITSLSFFKAQMKECLDYFGLGLAFSFPHFCRDHLNCCL